MSTYSSRLQPALQNLLQRVVRFFHPRSSCTTVHRPYIGRRSENNINASCMTISGRGRTEQLDIFCRVTGFTSDFLSFIVVELIHLSRSHSIVMRPSSLGGGRILRRTLSVCLSVCPSVCPSVPFAEVVL